MVFLPDKIISTGGEGGMISLKKNYGNFVGHIDHGKNYKV